MKFSIILLIVLSIQFVNMIDLSSYSIDTFLEYIQNSGYYEIFLQIKYYYGDDVAIATCKELVQSNDCDYLVKVYFPSRKNYIIAIKYYQNQKVKPTLEHIIMNPNNYNIYYVENEPKEIIEKINKIKKDFNIEY